MVTLDVPSGLAERGHRLWSESVRVKGSLSPGERVLLEEACRLVDRLDRFDRILSGDLNEWLSIDWPDEERPARLVISSVVSEARQSVAELRQVVKQLGFPAEEAAAKPESKLGRLLQLAPAAES